MKTKSPNFTRGFYCLQKRLYNIYKAQNVCKHFSTGKGRMQMSSDETLAQLTDLRESINALRELEMCLEEKYRNEWRNEQKWIVTVYPPFAEKETVLVKDCGFSEGKTQLENYLVERLGYDGFKALYCDDTADNFLRYKPDYFDMKYSAVLRILK